MADFVISDLQKSKHDDYLHNLPAIIVSVMMWFEIISIFSLNKFVIVDLINVK
jgi:hypothetical protein